MRVLAAVSWIIILLHMSADVSAKKLRPGLLKKTIVEKFVTAAGHSERNVRHEWMTTTAWAAHINKCLPIDGHTVQAKDTYDSIRFDPKLRHQNLDSKKNEEFLEVSA